MQRSAGGEAEKGKIGTLAGLPGLSLDALTSVAYGPEAIVVVLAATGTGAIAAVRPITVAIVVLLGILVFSYRQVIAAYPDGGGAYAVSKENLGRSASLVAGASLIVDYVLTVAVPITAGVAALTSALHGERAVYRSAVMVLAVLSAVLIVGSGGNTQTLIPLFAIGVFVGFTLAQSGLVRHWFTHRGPRWAGRALLNGCGATLSAAAALIFLATKFVHGAFIIVIVIPALVLLFRKINGYYVSLGWALGLNDLPVRPAAETPALVLVPVIGLSRLTSVVLAHALASGGEVRALHVAFEGEPTAEFEASWAVWDPGVPLITLPSPQRSVVRAFLAYLATPEVRTHENITVLIGEIEPRKLRHRLLLNQRGTILATILRRRTDAVVATVPFRLD